MNKLLSELKQIIVEFDFTHRWSEIEKFWTLGKELNDSKWHLKEDDIAQVADYMEIDEEELWDAILFFKKFPDLNMLPEGKNVSWHGIREAYLK